MSTLFVREAFSLSALKRRMYYSTYRRAVIVMLVAIGVVLCALFSFVSLALAIAFGIFYAVVCAVGLWFGFTLMEGAMAETGGVSSQQLFDLVDDRDPKVVDAYNRGLLPQMPDEEELDKAPTVENCPHCGAMLARPESVFCDECGQPIRAPPPSVPLPPSDSHSPHS